MVFLGLVKKPYSNKVAGIFLSLSTARLRSCYRKYYVKTIIKSNSSNNQKGDVGIIEWLETYIIR